MLEKEPLVDRQVAGLVLYGSRSDHNKDSVSSNSISSGDKAEIIDVKDPSFIFVNEPTYQAFEDNSSFMLDEDHDDNYCCHECFDLWKDKAKEGAAKFNRKTQLISRAKYYIPILSWLSNYNLENLKSDMIAGLNVGLMIVPQSLAFAVLIGIPPIFGLQSSFFPMIIYLFLGTSRQLSIGPEAVISILTTEALDELASDPEERMRLVTVLAFLIGLFTLIIGIFRFGFLAYILSRPLLCGFINAVAIEISLEQTDKFFGLDAPTIHSYWKLPFIYDNWSDINVAALVLGIVCLIVLIAFRLAKKRWKALQLLPDILLVVILTTVISTVFDLSSHGVAILGTVDAGFLSPAFPDIPFDRLTEVGLSALVIAIVGIVESILVATTYADKYSYRVSPNRELVALGTANLLGSIFLIFPSFGGLSRSAVNDAAGAKTLLASGITSCVVLITILLLFPLFQNLPKVVMGSIIGNEMILQSVF